MARFKNIRAVVLGLELNGLSVVRSLARHRVKVIGIDSDLEQTSSLTKYLLTRIRTEDIRGPSVIDTLEKIGADSRRHVLFPTMDATVLLLSEERERLPESLIYCLPEKDMVHRLMHKGSFRELCRSMGLNSPGYAMVESEAKLEEALEQVRFPLVMKSPLKKMGPAAKAARAENREEAMKAYADQGEGEVILEEWIPGKDSDVYFCLQAYSPDSELLASFVGRKIRQWPTLVGGTAAAEPADLPELESVTTGFFKAVKYQGIGSMEYKYDRRDKKYYAIEPTVGRTDFQSGIAPANGVNIPLAMFCEMAGESYKARRTFRPVKWVDRDNDANAAEYYIEQGELTPREWKRSLSGPCVDTLFAIDDPGPWVSDIFRRLVGRLKRLFSRNGRDVP
jgi:predicted ATP-grasp superfamily ATP-dependent carboligase